MLLTQTRKNNIFHKKTAPLFVGIYLHAKKSKKKKQKKQKTCYNQMDEKMSREMNEETDLNSQDPADKRCSKR